MLAGLCSWANPIVAQRSIEWHCMTWWCDALVLCQVVWPCVASPVCGMALCGVSSYCMACLGARAQASVPCACRDSATLRACGVRLPQLPGGAGREDEVGPLWCMHLSTSVCACVHARVDMCACIIALTARLCTCAGMSALMHTFGYLCDCASCGCISERCASARVYMCTCMCVHLHACMSACVCVCVHLFCQACM